MEENEVAKNNKAKRIAKIMIFVSLIAMAWCSLYLKNSYRMVKKYDVNSAVLFGSYAKKNARDNSDVDILVDSGLKGLAFFGLLEDVVNALGKPVDLIDVTQVDPNSTVMNEINQTGVMIYGR